MAVSFLFLTLSSCAGACFFVRRPVTHLRGWVGGPQVPPRHTLEAVAPGDTWDVWSSPSAAAAAGQVSAGLPEYVEVVIDDEMLAVGAGAREILSNNSGCF